MSVSVSIYRQSTYNSPSGSTDPGVWIVMGEINLVLQQSGTDAGKVTAIESIVRLKHPTATVVQGYIYYEWVYDPVTGTWHRLCKFPTTITIPEPPADPIVMIVQKVEVNEVG
jgi:hypothetical protein